MSLFHFSQKHTWIWTSCLAVVVFTSVLLPISIPTAEAVGHTLNQQGNPTTHTETEPGTGNKSLSWWEEIIAGAISSITSLFEEMAGWAMGASGLLFEAAIRYSLDSDHYRAEAISTGWSLFRDIANMTFIFLLVYIAFSAILQLGGNYQRMLITLLIIAVLVNFSFFLAGIVIDAGNILASFLYNIITDDGAKGIAAQLRDGLDITSLLSSGAFDGLNAYKEAVFHLFAAIFFLIAAFVFLAAAILFVIRTVALMLVLVVSPLAFVAAILDKTQGYWKMWLHKLINYSFVAPIYLLFIVIVIAVAADENAKEGALALQNTSNTPAFIENATLASPLQYAGKLGYSFADYSGTVAYFAILIGLLVASQIVARNMAGNLATTSVKYAGKVTGAAAGAAAFGGQQLAGRGSRRLRESKAVAKMLASDSKWKRRMGQALYGTADYGAKARYDVRAGITGKAVGATAGAALGAGGVQTSVGRPGREGGFDVRRTEAIRKAQKAAEARAAAAKRGAAMKAEEEGRRAELAIQQSQDVQKKAQAAGDEAALEAMQSGKTAKEEQEARKRAEENYIKTTADLARKRAEDEYKSAARKRIIEETAHRGFISSLTGMTAANREAAEVLRGKKDAPEAPQKGLSQKDVDRIVRGMKDST